MSEQPQDRPVLYMPDSPNVGDFDPAESGSDPKRRERDKAQADDLASKVSIGDELSEYERVAGRGVPET